MEEDIDEINGALPIDVTQQETQENSYQANHASQYSLGTNDAGVHKNISIDKIANDLRAKNLKVNKCGGFISNPSKNMEALNIIANKCPNYIISNDDLESLNSIFNGSSKALAGMAKDLLLKNCCGLSEQEKEQVVSNYEMRFNSQKDKGKASESIKPLEELVNSQQDNQNDSCDEEYEYFAEPVDFGLKGLETILHEIQEKNPKIDIKTLERQYYEVEDAFYGTSKIYGTKNIKLWNKIDISQWVTAFKKEFEEQKAPEKEIIDGKTIDKKHKYQKEIIQKFLPEIIAVMKQANFLFTKKQPENEGQGQYLRITQIVSLLIFIDRKSVV